MKELLELYQRGGPAMIAIMVLSVLLYSRCFHLLLWLYRERRHLRATSSASVAEFPILHRRQEEIQEAFRQQRIVLGAMIAAAPLLGLLGTVSGMAKTFESLANQTGQKSMEGLAHGISEVLVATESGLAVAIPALLLVYVAHRAVHRGRQQLNQLEMTVQGGATS